MDSFSKTDRRLTFILIGLYVIDPYSFGFVFGYCLGILIFLKLKHLIPLFDKTILSLFLFSSVYSAFYAFKPQLGIQFIFLYSIIPFVMYSAGSNLGLNSKKNILKITFLLGLAISIPSLASVFIDIYENGFVTLVRDVPNIWTGEKEPATNTAGKLIMNMCIPSLLLINWKIFSQKNWVAFGALLIFILSIIAILRLGSRTHLVIVIFTLFFSVLYKVGRRGIAKNIFFVIAIFVTLNTVFLYSNLDADNEVLSAYADRANSRSHGVSSAGGRVWKWEKSAEYIFTKPMGWQLNDIGLSHNLWFDTARVSGTLGFILLVLFTLKISASAVKKMFKKFYDNTSYKLEGLLLIYVLAFNLLFLVEPIMEGYFNCFVMFCFIAGVQSSISNDETNLKAALE